MREVVYLTVVFNDCATTEIYALSLHDALPIWSAAATTRCTFTACTTRRPPTARTSRASRRAATTCPSAAPGPTGCGRAAADRKSTRLNSSHANISYAVFCLKKKQQQQCRLRVR